MRIDKDKISFLKSELQKLSPKAKIFLFGSRIHDQNRGGDIDLLLLTDHKIDKRALRPVRREFFKKYGWQKLDIVNISTREQSSFKKIVLENAIRI